jgi:hypothetical protein
MKPAVNAPPFIHFCGGMNPEIVFVLVPTPWTLKYTPLQFCIQIQDYGLASKCKKRLVQWKNFEMKCHS